MLEESSPRTSNPVLQLCVVVVSHANFSAQVLFGRSDGQNGDVGASASHGGDVVVVDVCQNLCFI